jgi:hypothetical protein
MNPSISFLERAKMATAALTKQPAVTLKVAKEQAQWLKNASSSNVRKQRD